MFKLLTFWRQLVVEFFTEFSQVAYLIKFPDDVLVLRTLVALCFVSQKIVSEVQDQDFDLVTFTLFLFPYDFLYNLLKILVVEKFGTLWIL